MQATIDAGLAAVVVVSSTPDNEDLGYGADILCFETMDPLVRDVSGEDLLGQDLFHRLDTSRGTLIDDNDYGYDLVGLLHRPTTTQSIAMASQLIEQECQKDDRVVSVSATVKPSIDGKVWNISVNVIPQPPLQNFTLVLAVTDGQVLVDAIGN
jgi:hypothetical protein